jgi:large subunit ribosomal protein L15
MNLGNLKYASGSRKKVKRLGRGQGSGHGGTSTKGHKGDRARSGARFKPGFEGGQMPLHRRLPKFGFHNINRIEFQVINLSLIEKLGDSVITPQLLITKNLIKANGGPVKILGDGDLTRAIQVSANAFSKTAITKIEAKGGKAVIVETRTKKGIDQPKA